jgi:hypothetical protein
VATNPFKDREKKNAAAIGGQTDADADADAEFEEVAASLTPDNTGAEYVGNVEDVSAAQAAGADDSEKFIVTDKLSAKVVWAIFYPLANYRCGGLGHPAWEVTPEESMKVAPPVTELLQEYVDKWVPAFLSRMGQKHSKLMSALLALSGLAAQKMMLVRELRVLEAQRAEKEKADAEAAARASREVA